MAGVEVVGFVALGKKISSLSRVEKQSGVIALNTVAFIARKKLIENIDKRFKIDSPWVKFGVRVTKASEADAEPIAEVWHRYFGLAQQETGGKRGQSRKDPWIIPTKAGEDWLKSAGFKREA